MIDLRIGLYELDPDGTTRLVVVIPDQSPDVAEVALAQVGGTVTTNDDGGVSVAWTWPAGMAPDDPRGACRRHIENAVAVWAASWVSPDDTAMGVAIAEPGEAL